MWKKALLVLGACTALACNSAANDDVIGHLPGFIEKGMADWHVPGMAVAVVSDSEVLFQRAFGTTAASGGEAVDIHTAFAIASTTKAMVATAVLMLVDEKKLALDDLAIEYLPELQFGESWLNGQVTVRDLLTHRTGLASTDFWTFFQGMALEDQIALLKNVEPSASLRSSFQYQNTMFEFVGEIIERVSGEPWEDFVRARIWQPLQMDETYAARGRIAAGKSHVLPHRYVDGELIRADWDLDADLADAAGSVWSSVSDMGRWAQFLLRGGLTADGERLLSEEGLAELFKPQMLISPEEFYPTMEITGPNWISYGLGWFQQDFQGRKIDFHTGSLSGLIAMVGLDRDSKRAVVVLGNRDHAEMRHAVLWRVMDEQPAGEVRDWNQEILQLYRGIESDERQEWEATVVARLDGTSTSLAPERYLGTYRHDAFGDLQVIREADGLKLVGGKIRFDLSHWHLDTMLAENAEYDWRLLVTFTIDSKPAVRSLEAFGLVFTHQDEPLDE